MQTTRPTFVVFCVLTLLLSSALYAEHWSAEGLMKGLDGFKAGAEVVDAPDGGNGMVYESAERGNIALEGKPGKIWRFHHTFFYTEKEEMYRALVMTLRVIVNATGMDRKEAAKAVTKALVAAKHSDAANNRFELAGRTFYVAHKPVLKRHLVMLSLQALPETAP